MLTGMFKASGGDAIIYGKSILDEMASIQKNIGLCQQFDVLFNNLSCQEHLEFVCEVKNVPKNKIPEIIKRTLAVVMLHEHKDK